ncbi:MAG TPA: carboxypeptidase-like regulatory domain-containing protein [Brevefilum sp.]
MNHRAASSLIDEQVWQEIMTSPTRETTFFLRLNCEGEESIDAQLRLEQMLGLMREAGQLDSYHAFYGKNIIKINGGAGILQFLSDWPELAQISAYNPGEEWESQYLESPDSAVRAGTAQITGIVTAEDGITPLPGIRLTAYLLYPPTDWHVAGQVETATNGTYTLSGLEAGIYRVRFDDLSGNYVTEFYNNKTTFALATNFEVLEGATVSNINASLAFAGKISGTITFVSGGGTEDGLVASAWSNATGSWLLIANAITNSSGDYTIVGLSAGNYRVKFSDSSLYVPPRYVSEYYDNKLTIDTAQDVSVTAGDTTTGINAALGSYGSVKGNVKAYDGTTNLGNITIDIYRYDTTYANWHYFATGTTDASGNYEIFGLGTENVRVGFYDFYGQFDSEFYNNQAGLGSADDVAVALGYPTSNINAQLSLNTDTENIELVSGWNLVSVSMNLDINYLPDAFTSIAGNYGDVWTFESGQWQVYNPENDPVFNDFSTINNARGYWVKMSALDTLSLTGTHPLTTAIPLQAGWNLIGYPSVTKKEVGTALSSIIGKYSLVQQYKASDTSDPWKIYNPSAPSSLNDLKELEPGFGYWIYMTQDATLNIEGR